MFAQQRRSSIGDSDARSIMGQGEKVGVFFEQPGEAAGYRMDGLRAPTFPASCGYAYGA
jgi:hypothetical protein